MAGRSAADICNMALVYAGINTRIGSLTQPNNAAAQVCNTIYDTHRQNLLGAFRWPFAQRRKQLVPLSGVPYDAAHAYATGDTVQYGSNVYRSRMDANTGHTPSDDASAAWWAQVTRDGYLYVFPVPDDCLEPIEVWPKLNVSATSVPTARDYQNDTGFSLRTPRSNQREPFKLENANDGSDTQVLLSDLSSLILRYTGDVTNPTVLPTGFVVALAWDLAGPLARSLKGDEKKGDSCDRTARVKLSEAFVESMRGQQDDQEPISEFEAAREGGR